MEKKEHEQFHTIVDDMLKAIAEKDTLETMKAIAYVTAIAIYESVDKQNRSLVILEFEDAVRSAIKMFEEA